MDLLVVIWLALFFYFIIKGIGQWIENENSPVITVQATIVDMRRKTHHHHHRHGASHTHSYHITFQKEDGEQIELKVRRSEYRNLAIGDTGMLTHQGTRYQGFIPT